MRRFTRILCPIDFSDISSHALEHAFAFARWYDAAVTGLFVYTPVYATTPGVGMYAYGAPPIMEEIEPAAYERDLLAFIGRADPSGIATSAQVAVGLPAQEIVAAAKALPADLVVVGSHGTTGFEHLMLGSIAERVLRTCPAPVLTVPPRAAVTSRLPMKRVLCPVDFSEPAKAAVRVALSIAQEGDAEITILHVADVPRDEPLTTRPIATPEFYAEYEAAAREQLGALLADGAGDWCRPRTLIRHGKAYREILAEAAASSADLIVIGVHGRNPLDLMLFGSTTNQVVRRATCPVLTVRS
jgi:nucleotide-binding universal stress UspA family protein